VSAEVTYGSYLRIDDLLSLQDCESSGPEHDELLFIIIHQVYELWFKEVLHELDRFVEHLDNDDPAAAEHQLKRVLKILKTLVGQLDVLETMTPIEFQSFRAFLDRASGFQSAQFRELEFLLGAKTRDNLDRFSANPREFANLSRRFGEPTIWDAFLALIDRRGYHLPDQVLSRDVTQPTAENSAVQDRLVDIYRSDAVLTAVCEALTDLDEGLQEWRYRHVAMVQRTIGTKSGTGGSSGAEYLRSTLFRPVFPDLWTIRARF